VTDRLESRLSIEVPGDVPVYVFPHNSIDELVGFRFHRGMLGCGQRRSWPDLSEIAAGRAGRLTLVVCPRLSNPDNLGTIARIGGVFGIDGILAGAECPDPLSRRVLRVSMGAVLRLPVIVASEPDVTADELVRQHGFELWGAVTDPAAESFDQVKGPEKLALVLGDEHHGIDAEWLRRCHRLVTIPMRDDASSLNVAVAAGILLYGLSREDRP
jgi:tRNA G18 (ribose-2'-O)-methylase SpoU